MSLVSALIMGVGTVLKPDVEVTRLKKEVAELRSQVAAMSIALAELRLERRPQILSQERVVECNCVPGRAQVWASSNQMLQAHQAYAEQLARYQAAMQNAQRTIDERLRS